MRLLSVKSFNHLLLWRFAFRKAGMKDGDTVRRDTCVRRSQQTRRVGSHRERRESSKHPNLAGRLRYWNQMSFSWRLDTNIILPSNVSHYQIGPVSLNEDRNLVHSGTNSALSSLRGYCLFGGGEYPEIAIWALGATKSWLLPV